MKFKDVNENYWACKAIEDLSEKNVVIGYDDGTFRPDNFLTRAEAVAFIAREHKEYDNNKKYSISAFSDVNEDAWYANYLGFVYKKGFVIGYEDGTFKPDKLITRAEIATIINRI